MIRQTLFLFFIALLAGCGRSSEETRSSGDQRTDAPKPPTKNETPPPAKKFVDTRRKDGTVIEGWGTVSDSNGDCTIREHEGYVTISIPATVHDINPTKDQRNAPRVLRPVEGDFRAVVRVTGEFNPVPPSTGRNSVPFNGAGLLLYADEFNLLWMARDKWVRSATDSEGICYAPLFELFEAGKSLNTNPRIVPATVFQGDSTSLYLERKGDTLIGMYSQDKKTWEGRIEAKCNLPRKLFLGVCAVSTSSRPFEVAFDQFKLLE